MIPESTDWTGSVVLTLGGLAALGTALTKFSAHARKLWLWLVDRVQRMPRDMEVQKTLHQSLLEMRRMRQVLAVCEQWMHGDIGAQRCLLLTANNGGEEWKGSGPLYVSCLGQAKGPAEPDTTELWQEWKADSWYRRFLGKMLEAYEAKRGYPLVMHDGAEPGADEPQGLLRSHYIEQGTYASLVLPFVWREGAVCWYVSVNFGRREGDSKHTVRDRETFRRQMLAIYDSHAACRRLTLELRSAYESVR